VRVRVRVRGEGRGMSRRVSSGRPVLISDEMRSDQIRSGVPKQEMAGNMDDATKQ
jgi:hypothetical protein